MTVIHPLVGIAAVPFTIQLGSSLGANSGAKVGDAIAYSKCFMDKTERYDLGEVKNDDENQENIAYQPCYYSDDDHDDNNDNAEAKKN